MVQLHTDIPISRIHTSRRAPRARLLASGSAHLPLFATRLGSVRGGVHEAGKGAERGGAQRRGPGPRGRRHHRDYRYQPGSQAGSWRVCPQRTPAGTSSFQVCSASTDYDLTIPAAPDRLATPSGGSEPERRSRVSRYDVQSVRPMLSLADAFDATTFSPVAPTRRVPPASRIFFFS